MSFRFCIVFLSLSLGAMLPVAAMDFEEIQLNSTSLYSSFKIAASYYDQMSNKEIIDRLPNEDESRVALQVIATRFCRGLVASDIVASSSLKARLKDLDPHQMTNDQIYMELKLTYKEWFSKPRADLVKEIISRGNKHDPYALFLEGWLWKKGFGVSKDEGKAQKLLEVAASQGTPLAILTLAKIKYQEEDYEAEERLRLKAWENGWPASYYNYAKLRLEKYWKSPCFLYYFWAAKAGHQKAKSILKAKVAELEIIRSRDGERPATLIPVLEKVGAMVKGLYNLNLWHIIEVSPRSEVAQYQNMGDTFVNFITFTNFLTYFLENIESPHFGLRLTQSGHSYGGMVFDVHCHVPYLFFSRDPQQPGKTLALLESKDSSQQHLKFFLRDYSDIAILLKKGASFSDESAYIEGLYDGACMERQDINNFKKVLLLTYLNASSEVRTTILNGINADLSFLQEHVTKKHTSCQLLERLFEDLAPYRGYQFITKVLG